MPCIVYRIILQIEMPAEVIKLSSFKHDFPALISELSNKLKSYKPYDITLILKHNEQIQSEEEDITIKPESDHFQLLNCSFECQQKNNLATKYPFPLFLSQKEVQKKAIRRFTTFKKKSVKISQQIDERQDQGVQTSQKNISLGQAIKEDSQKNSIKVSYQIQVESDYKKRKQSITVLSAEIEQSDLGLLVEGELNKALNFFNLHQNSNLEQFLYQFKEKHAELSIRTKIKWALLMAYCKQQKLQFERAASNYRQIIQIFRQNPVIYFISLADIYHSLALCLYRIQQFNKSITAFSQAIELYKKQGNVSHYSLCISNLGALYLQVDYPVEAEKCFLISYKIKKQLMQHSNCGEELFLLLFNILDCNFRLRNLIQCQHLLKIIQNKINEKLIEQVSFTSLLIIKKAKLKYLQGDIAKAKQYSHAASKMATSSSNLNQRIIAEIAELEGVFQLQSNNLKEARSFFVKAINTVREKILPSESRKVKNLKNNVSMTVRDKPKIDNSILNLRKMPQYNLENNKPAKLSQNCCQN